MSKPNQANQMHWTHCIWTIDGVGVIPGCNTWRQGHWSQSRMSTHIQRVQPHSQAMTFQIGQPCQVTYWVFYTLPTLVLTTHSTYYSVECIFTMWFIYIQDYLCIFGISVALLMLGDILWWVRRISLGFWITLANFHMWLSKHWGWSLFLLA